jgi:predicted kinase
MSGRIYLLCGKTGAGKTTYARQLEEQGAIRFSLDDWMIRLYGHQMSRELFDQRVQICEEIFFDLAEAIASRGVDVVIDHGFWKRAARDRARQRFAKIGVRIELVYSRICDRVPLERLRARNAALPAGTFVITGEMFEQFSRAFEPPDDFACPIFMEHAENGEVYSSCETAGERARGGE